MLFSLRPLSKFNLLALALLSISVVAAVAVVKRSFPKTSSPQMTSATALAATAPTETKSKEVDALVPDGMPITFTDLPVLSTNREQNEIKVTLSNRGVSKADSFSYSLYEFNAAGNLVRVEGGIKVLDVVPGKATPISIIPKRISNPNHRIMLGVEKVTDEKDSWSVLPLDLAKAGEEKAKAKPPSSLTGKKDKEKIKDDSGAALCVNAYRRAVELSEAGEKPQITSLTCDQNSRVFTMTFDGKPLVK